MFVNLDLRLLKVPPCNFLVLPYDSNLHLQVRLEIALYEIFILPRSLPNAILDKAEWIFNRV